MGSMFIDSLNNLDISFEQQIAMHLQGNLYPPVPLTMVQPSMDAIDAYYEFDFNREIDLPDGVLYKGYLTSAPASAIVSNHRLEHFIDLEDENF